MRSCYFNLVVHKAKHDMKAWSLLLPQYNMEAFRLNQKLQNDHSIYDHKIAKF